MADPRTTIIQSPNQAATIFGLDKNSVPRKKSLFYVRFVGNLGNLPTWQNNLGFLVKSIDRPAVQVLMEDVNQYNKKRKITTGFKIPNIKMSLYDTVDGLVMQMWDEYSKYYFGDFNQADEANFQYDATTNEIKDNGSGFGYVPRWLSNSSGESPLDLNTQFFFRKIEVYQLFNNKYTQYDLINPRIESFDPDDLDYELSNPSIINMTIAYEALLYRDNNQPQPIENNADVLSAFRGNFNGNTPMVTGASVRSHDFNFTPEVFPMQDNFKDTINLPNNLNLMSNPTSTNSSGALSMFGDYDFGSTNNPTNNGILGDMTYMTNNMPSLISTLNLPSAPIYNSTGKSITSPNNTSGISGSAYDLAIGSLEGAGNETGSTSANNYINKKIVGGVMSSSIINKTSTNDQIVKTYNNGLELNSQSYAIVNSQQSITTQIGVSVGKSYTSESVKSSSAPLTQRQIDEFNASINGGL